MTWKHWIIAAAGGSGLALIVAGAQSAPLGSAARVTREWSRTLGHPAGFEAENIEAHRESSFPSLCPRYPRYMTAVHP